jgi:hypothetical protein
LQSRKELSSEKPKNYIIKKGEFLLLKYPHFSPVLACEAHRREHANGRQMLQAGQLKSGDKVRFY